MQNMYSLRNIFVELCLKSPSDFTGSLSLQAYYGHQEALCLLCETLVSLDVRDIEGRTALHLAAERGFSTCVEVLLQHHASYTLKEYKHKWTALHAAGVSLRPLMLR